jgi:hypothetical protein
MHSTRSRAFTLIELLVVTTPQPWNRRNSPSTYGYLNARREHESKWDVHCGSRARELVSLDLVKKGSPCNPRAIHRRPTATR